MARYTVSQLRPKGETYTLLDSDLLLVSTGTATYDLSSVRMSLREFGDYAVTTYAQNRVHGFALQGPLSAQVGLSAHGGAPYTIRLENLPTTSSGLQTGDLYTQTVTQIHGSGGTAKILMVA